MFKKSEIYQVVTGDDGCGENMPVSAGRMKPLKWVRAYIQKTIFSDELSFHARMVNMVSIVGTGSLALATLARFFMGSSLAVNTVMLTFCFLGVFFIYLTNKYHLHNGVFWFVLIVICDILLPASFFLIGGADSGIAAFVVMSATCILLLSTGKSRIIIMAIHLFLMSGCFIFAAYHPYWVVQIDPGNPLSQAIDNIQCFVISTIFVGVTITFQRSMYSEERTKVEMAKADVERERQVSLALFEESPHINALFDDKLQLIDLNPAAIRFAEGAASEEELKQNLPEILARATPIIQPNGRPSADLMTWLRKTEREGEVNFETTLKLCGVERNVSVVMKRIPYADSFGIVAYLVDNSEFYKMRREALLSARAKSDFLANMSHEIRTPLNAVISMNTIGRAASDIERKDYAFDQIGDAADHLLGIINDILDMSKIEANKLELDKQAFNVEDALHRVANVISFKTSEKRQQFTVSIDEKMPVGLVTDGQRLSQIITNLLSNAVKFTPEGGHIDMSAELLYQSGGLSTVQFSVRDTGIGIPADNLERIFHSFEQVESSTARKFGGTGLGLTISKRFAEMMGGELSVISEPGEGSTFSFTIKAEATDAFPGVQLYPNVAPGKIRCLVINARDVSRAGYEMIARSIGISCDFADGRQQAEELLAKSHYDICAFGSRIDGGAGGKYETSIELARHIREMGSADHVVMAVDPFELNEAENKDTTRAIGDYLIKPLFRSDCVALLNKIYGEDTVEEEPSVFAEEMDFSGVRLLLAEDLEINKEIVCALFEPFGFEVDWARNGREALEMYESEPSRYDLILMDMQMPEMDGLEATRKIRALPDFRARRVPIIALTANVFKEDIDNSIAAGMNDHIGKPLDLNTALQKIAFHLRSRKHQS
jgi:signal transduction histidine kinase/CheY-like chemotaxis protein